jgi:hypothetical protein
VEGRNTIHVAKYLSHWQKGMEGGKELMEDLTYDSKDVSAYGYDDLVSATYYSADKLLARTPLPDVLPITYIHAQQRNASSKATRSGPS